MANPPTLFDVPGYEMKIPICALLDGQFRRRLAEIIQERGITTVVETGLDRGGSTMIFSRMVPHVIGIENMAARVDAVRAWLTRHGVTNVRLFQGNSPDVLKNLSLDWAHTLCFLDAHWQSYWPLRDEIRMLSPGHGVIVLHDARVPGCPELGVDSYDGQELDYAYVREVLTAWSPTHRVEYNDNAAEWPRRGIMYVYPE